VINESTRVVLHSDALAGMSSRPKNLQRALVYNAEELGFSADVVPEGDFPDALGCVQPGDQLLELWRRQLTQWDFVEDPAWSDTKPRTVERRIAVFALLGLGGDTAKRLEELIPVSKVAGPVVISVAHKEWYTPEATGGRSWYWPAYTNLLESKGWDAAAVTALGEASDRVIERLANPSDAEAYQAKGLVVGYVQSGKTANFTAVIAKAVDAGYRLVIVLGGTLNLLRAQTQRRLDMELVGKENILRGSADYESDYAADSDWAQNKFLTHGGLPSALGAFDIVRMTTRDNDYKSLLQGIVALEFEKQEPALPLHNPRNLHRSSARLMVVKKNKSVLAKLVKDLNKIKTPLGEIPVLIIDDESDEASVNTANLAKPNAERTAINKMISELLRILPRAQYVGYTATPFANVFIDPNDAEDIFPKDFIISLPRPAGYMGVQDFHDLDGSLEEAEKTFANSNEKAYVRDVLLSHEGDDTCLREALDMFVLTAAIKLYREANGLGTGYFRHHTMLVHESVRTADHRELMQLLTQLWYDSGYTGQAGHDRLRRLFETDALPVSQARASDDLPMPQTFSELSPYIGAAVMRIGADEKPIIVVNGDKDIETGEADFDNRSIWRILVGGQKLARGYTVEGLTVTYYRRRTNNASTLMQMGRWFGFRTGYRDLVRLYVGREETLGTRDIDLYEAFEAICRDEEAFRAQLELYSSSTDGERITPAEVPPLVSQQLPWLKPTSTNKMFNAELVSQGERWLRPRAYASGKTDLAHNAELWQPLFRRFGDTPPVEVTYADAGSVNRDVRYLARLATATHNELLDVLRGQRWLRTGNQESRHFAPYLEFLTRMPGDAIDEWVLIAPQLANHENRANILGVPGLSLHGRTRRPGTLVFGSVSRLPHRQAAELVASGHPDRNGPLAAFTGPRRGAVLVYPVVELKTGDDTVTSIMDSTGVADAKQLVMAFEIAPPGAYLASVGRLVQYRTRSGASASGAIEPIVERDDL